MHYSERLYRGGDRVAHKDTDRPEHRIKLATNPTLDLIVKGLESIDPDFEGLISDLSKTQKARLDGDKNGILLGKLAEMHVYQVLLRLSEDDRIHPLIRINPIPDGHETKSFRFGQYRQNLIVYEKGTTVACVELDLLTEIDGLPVVWEVKSGTSLSSAVSTQRINTIATPLIEHYASGAFGYVVVATINPSDKPPNKAQEIFTKKNGIIVRIPTTRKDFESGIKAANGNGNGNGYHS